MSKFFTFIDKAQEADLYIEGEIISDEYSEIYEAYGVKYSAPAGFKQALSACGNKPLNIYVDSYGGDVIAASAIYAMLREYKGEKTVKVNSIAASAASVIAMAGDKLLMSPTAFLMIHDPSTIAVGNITEVEQTLDAMKQIKEGIINAYEKKSNLTREQLADLMTNETWIDYTRACEWGFCDGEIGTPYAIDASVLNSIKENKIHIYNKLRINDTAPKPVEPPQVAETAESGESIEDNAKTVRERKLRLYGYKK